MDIDTATVILGVLAAAALAVLIGVCVWTVFEIHEGER